MQAKLLHGQVSLRDISPASQHYPRASRLTWILHFHTRGFPRAVFVTRRVSRKVPRAKNQEGKFRLRLWSLRLCNAGQELIAGPAFVHQDALRLPDVMFLSGGTGPQDNILSPPPALDPEAF